MTTDSDRDARMDRHLREAGRRWREEHDEAVGVDVSAVVAGGVADDPAGQADRAGPAADRQTDRAGRAGRAADGQADRAGQTDRAGPAAEGQADRAGPAADGQTDRAGRAGRAAAGQASRAGQTDRAGRADRADDGERAGRWHRHARWVGPLAAAAVVAVVVGLSQLGGSAGQPAASPAGADTAAPGSSAGTRTVLAGGEEALADPTQVAALTGHEWALATLQPAGGQQMAAVSEVPLRISGEADDATVSISDGCATARGPVRIGALTLTFGDLPMPEVGCIGRPGGFETQREEIRKLLAGYDPVQWTVSGGTLTLSRPGIVTLTYTPAPVEQPADPTDVFTGRWTLTTIQSAPSGTAPDASVSAGPAPDGAFVRWSDGKLSGSSGCNEFRGNFTATETTLTVTNFGYTGDQPPCPEIYFWPNTLDGMTQWSATDGRLVITAEDGSALYFRDRSAD